MTMGLTFLGTGTSQGIPVVGCNCSVCHSDDLRDQRYRTSAVLHLDQRNILIDATPELRLQCLHNGINRLDGILITHTHADHIFGLDDVRSFNQLQREAINLWARPKDLETLERVFGYARAERAGDNFDLPRLLFNPVDGPIDLFGHTVEPLLLPHGQGTVLGFRVGPLAYCTDISEVSDALVSQLQGLELLVLGALRQSPHPKHLSIDQAVLAAEKIAARNTYFVHMSHHVSHRKVQQQLPSGINLAYDGLKVGPVEFFKKNG